MTWGVKANTVSMFEAPCEPNSALVRAQITDPQSLSTVELRYRHLRTESAAWLAVPMQSQGTYYEADLANLAPGPWVYVVRAVNNLGLAGLSEPHGLLVRACATQGPDVNLAEDQLVLSVTPCHPSRAMVQAQIGDTAGAAGAYLLARFGDGAWEPRPMQVGGSGAHVGVLGEYDQAGVGSFVVVARNSLGGWGFSEIGQFEAKACQVPTLGAIHESADPVFALPCDASRLTIDIEATDPAGISGGWLVYGEAGLERTKWTQAALQKMPGMDRWGADVGPFGEAGGYAYAFYVVNNVGGGAWSQAGAFVVAPCRGIVIDAVSVSPNPVHLAPCEPRRATIKAQVTAPAGVEGVWVSYSEPGLEVIQHATLPMQPAAQQGWYEITLPPLGVAGAVEFAVAARSVEGQWAWSEPQRFQVLACEGPTIENVASSESSILAAPCLPNTTQISARVIDPAGIAKVELRYRDRTEDAWHSVDMAPQGVVGVYRATLGPLRAGAKQYLVVATSTLGAVSTSEVQTLVVGLCA